MGGTVDWYVGATELVSSSAALGRLLFSSSNVFWFSKGLRGTEWYSYCLSSRIPTVWNPSSRRWFSVASPAIESRCDGGVVSTTWIPRLKKRPQQSLRHLWFTTNVSSLYTPNIIAMTEALAPPICRAATKSNCDIPTRDWILTILIPILLL